MAAPKFKTPESKVDLIEDVDLAIRVFRRGTRQLGQSCRLMISLNGEERLHFSEDAGDRAPSLLVIDLRMPARQGSVLIRALRSRPWKTRDAPVIIYAPEGDGGDLDGPIGYLVKSPPIDYVLETIYQALDLDDVSALTRPRRAGQTWLDARTG